MSKYNDYDFTEPESLYLRTRALTGSSKFAGNHGDTTVNFVRSDKYR